METQTYEGKINLFVHTQQGFDAHVEVTGVPHNLLAGTLDSLSQILADRYNMTASTRFGGSSNGNAHQKPQEGATGAPAAQQGIGPAPPCHNCNGDCWDNRQNKRNPKGPDFKCKDTACGWAAWIDKKTNGLTWKGPAL